MPMCVGWASMPMILEFPDGAFNRALGFLYSPDGTISAVATDAWAVRNVPRAIARSHPATLKK